MAGIWKTWLVGVLIGIPTIAAAADYTHGGSSDNGSATIWLKSNVNTRWADLHYSINSGAQQNVRMAANATTARYEYRLTATTGNQVNYWFTYNNGPAAYDTPRFNYVVGSTTTPLPEGPVHTVPGKVEAEAWLSMSGVQTEDTTDGGGKNVGWIDAGDWMDYRLNVASAGTYLLDFRVASLGGNGAFQLRSASGATLATMAVPNTGGWQNWTTVRTSIALPAGQQTLRLYATGAGWNLNWINLLAAGSNGNEIPVGNQVMTLQIKNATSGAYGDNQVYWSVIGYHPITRQLSWVDRQGNLIPASVNDNQASNHLVKNGQSYANYFHKLSDLNWVSLPRIDSGRMFLSLGSPMYIKINTAADGRTGFAGPDLGNPTDPNQDVYFEWVEFTIDQYGYHGNSTRVDQFGFPIRTRLVGKDGYDRTLGETASRESLLSAFESQVPPDFQKLVKRPYRIVAPGKAGFGHGGRYSNYFDRYVDQVWETYRNRDLVFTAEAGTFRGRVIGNDFVFSKDGGPQNLYIRGKPTTEAILEGSGNLASGNPLELVVQAQITAAFNRHLLVSVDPANWSNASYYYQQGPANYFARFWHQYSIDGLAYGFCYDDVRNHSSLLEHPNPKALVVTAGW